VHQKKLLKATKYGIYGLFLLGIYVLQTTPDFLQVFGIKPQLILPAVICIAMYEGEFIGGLFGVLGGLLCDMASNAIFGFYSIQLLVICVTVGLLIIYLIKNNELNALLLCAGVLLYFAVTEYFFYFGMWNYEGSWILLFRKMLPTAIYSLLFAPFFYRLEGWFFQHIEERIRQ